jgi:hypothetical protein
LTSHEVAFKLLNIVFDVLRFMGYRKVEIIVPQAEAERVKPIFQASFGNKI